MTEYNLGSNAGTIVISIVTILVGLLFCFFGYRVFKVILGIAGFLLGYSLVSNLVALLSVPMWVIVLSGVVAGLILAFLSAFVFYLGVFVLGAYFGTTLAWAISALIGTTFTSSPWIWPLVFGLAVLFGILAVVFYRFMIIFSSSFAGAWCIVSGLLTLVLASGITPFDSYTYVMVAAWVVLGILGMIVQYKVTAKKKLERERESEN